MREVFGDGRVVQHPAGGFAIEAPGLHAPAQLLPGTDGTAVPDLSSLIGQVISYVGILESTGDNLEHARIHGADLQIPAEPIAAPSPMWAIVSGNLGKAPEPNPKGDRLTASIAYDKKGEATSWLRLTSYAYFAISDLFRGLEAGTAIEAYGAMESYDYNGKPRLQLAIRGLQLLKSGGSVKTPTSLMAARSAADIAPHAFDEAA